MKIALLAHNKFPIVQPYAGGLEMITHLLAEKLQTMGHEVHLYALDGSDSSLKIIALNDDSINWAALRKKQISKEISDDYIDNLMYSLALAKIEAENYDIVHNHSMHHLPIVWGEISSLKVITTFHTPVFEDIHRGLTSIKSTNNQKFTTVSAKLGRIYEELISDYSVIYNGINVQNWNFHPEANKGNVCWIGRICKEKAPHKAIEFALKAKKKIVLAGPVSEETYFREYVKPLLEHNAVQYAGHLEQKELNKIMGKAEATLFTSVWEEPYGLVIAESLACGTPVIAWNVGAAPEIISAKSGIVVPAFKEELFISAIKNISTINRQACRDRAINFCDASIMVKAYEKLYNYSLTEKQLLELRIS